MISHPAILYSAPRPYAAKPRPCCPTAALGLAIRSSWTAAGCVAPTLPVAWRRIVLLGLSGSAWFRTTGSTLASHDVIDPRREECAAEVSGETPGQVMVGVKTLFGGALQPAIDQGEGSHEVLAWGDGGGGRLALRRC